MKSKTIIVLCTLISLHAKALLSSDASIKKNESHKARNTAIGTIGTVTLGGLAMVIYKIFGNKNQSRLTINSDKFSISSQTQLTKASTSPHTSQSQAQSPAEAESSKTILFNFKTEDLENALTTDSHLPGIQSIINLGKLKLTSELERACLEWVVRNKSLDGLKYFTEECKLDLNKWEKLNRDLYNEVMQLNTSIEQYNDSTVSSSDSETEETPSEKATNDLIDALEKDTVNQDAILECLSRGADVNCDLEDGDTILTWVIRNFPRNIVNILIASTTTDFNKVDGNGDTPLVSAIKSCKTTVAETLVPQSNIKEQDEKYGLVSLAISKLGTTFVQKLIDAGASPNQENPSGITPLMSAGLQISPDQYFELLFAKGADVNMQSTKKDNQTTPMMLIKCGHFDTAFTLITKYQANVLIADKDGKTLVKYYNDRFGFTGQQHPELKAAIDNAEQHNGIYVAPPSTKTRRVTLH